MKIKAEFLEFYEVIKASDFLHRCGLCGIESNDYYMVPDWDTVIPKDIQKLNLCFSCYNMFRILKGLEQLEYEPYDILVPKHWKEID